MWLDVTGPPVSIGKLWEPIHGYQFFWFSGSFCCQVWFFDSPMETTTFNNSSLPLILGRSTFWKVDPYHFIMFELHILTQNQIVRALAISHGRVILSDMSGFTLNIWSFSCRVQLKIKQSDLGVCFCYDQELGWQFATGVPPAWIVTPPFMAMDLWRWFWWVASNKTSNVQAAKLEIVVFINSNANNEKHDRNNITLII